HFSSSSRSTRKLYWCELPHRLATAPTSYWCRHGGTTILEPGRSWGDQRRSFYHRHPQLPPRFPAFAGGIARLAEDSVAATSGDAEQHPGSGTPRRESSSCDCRAVRRPANRYLRG